MEKLLHYIWKHKIFPLTPLQTDSGQTVEVIDPGISNNDSGPDFFNAKIRIEDKVWVGNVEIHKKASDWYHHKHEKNTAYDNVILHVIHQNDMQVRTSQQQIIPQLTLPIPQQLIRQYELLKSSEDYPRCHEIIPKLDSFMIHSWMSALVYERMQQRSSVILERLKKSHGNWEQTFFVTLARNFGFGLNGDAFERWAWNIPLQACARHRDSLFQTEAFFIGQAGLLETNSMDSRERQAALSDEYFVQLHNEYCYLKHKFETESLDAGVWRFMRTRPQNFPHIRLSQLSRLYHEEKISFSLVRDLVHIDDIRNILQVSTSSYWEEHYLFGYPSAKVSKKITPRSVDLLLINTVIPTLFAYGRQLEDTRYIERAVELLEQLAAENNHIIRIWQQCGLTVQHAADSQALIQLKKEYCDRHECLRCRFGFEFLTKEKII